MIETNSEDIQYLGRTPPTIQEANNYHLVCYQYYQRERSRMSVKIKISYTDPEELDTIREKLEPVIEPARRQQKGLQNKEIKRYYINGEVRKK